MNELALFAGAGGGILGGHLLGWRTVCAVEWEAYPASVLVARQNDKILPTFPIWDDVQTFDGKPWRGIVDVVSGGFPCQDISIAGKGDGLDGQRSGMWHEMARIVSEVRPRYVFVENSPMLTSRGLGTVLRDLAKLGYDAEWGVLGANEVGANHRRDRIWLIAKDTQQPRFFSHTEHNRLGWRKQQSESIKEKTSKYTIGQLADTNSIRHIHRKSEINSTENGVNALSNTSTSSSNVANTKKLLGNGGNNHTRISMEREKESESRNNSWSENVANTTSINAQIQFNNERESSERFASSCNEYGNKNYWKVEPNVGRVVDGMADRVDRLKAIGNGQVPLCAATAWNILKGRIDDKS